MGGDIDRAVQLIITRAEMGQDIKPNQTQVRPILGFLPPPSEMSIEMLSVSKHLSFAICSNLFSLSLAEALFLGAKSLAHFVSDKPLRKDL